MLRRSMFYALVLSIALHLAALAGLPHFDFLSPTPAPDAVLQVVVAPAPVVTPSPPVAPAAQPEPEPKPKLKLRPESQPAPTAVVAQTNATEAVGADDANAASEAQANAVSETNGASEPAADAARASADPAAYPVRAARLVFDLYYGESATLAGEVVQTWSLSGTHYVVESSAEAVGLLSLFLGGRYVQRSEGELGPQGFVPQRYTVQDRRKSRPESAEFDWAAGEVRFVRGSKRSRADLPPGAQDPLSAVHQLYFMRPLPPGVMLPLATTHRLERMLFQNMGMDEVDTGYGPVRARHMKREDLDGATTEVWLDPARSFLPVRVRTLNRNGYLLDQRLREASITRADDDADDAGTRDRAAPAPDASDAPAVDAPSTADVSPPAP